MVYAKAQDEVNDIVFGGDTTETRSAYAKRVNAELKDVEKRLDKANKAYVTTLPKPMRADNNAFKATVTAFAAKLSDMRRGTYIELNTGVKTATGAIKTEINKAFRKLNKSDNHMGKYLDVIKSAFENRDILTVEYQNGAKVKLGNYAAMLARTSRIETDNVNRFINALNDGTDLVQCIGQSPTCELCAIYRGRVFSITGKSKNYPPLYDGENSPLRNGYNAIHPNCRCQFVPYYPELEAKEQVVKDKARSNEPFADNRTKKERDEYAAWQSTNRKLWREQSEYEKMQSILGDEMPYKTLAGFRRVKRSYDATNGKAVDNLTQSMYNNYAKVRMAYNDKVLQAKIIASYPKTIEIGKQGKHIVGHNNYQQGKSVLTITIDEAQEFVNKYAGHGVIRRTADGRWTHKEVIDTGRIIGYCVTFSGEKIDTTMAVIHYSKKGVHIVPTIGGKKRD